MSFIVIVNSLVSVLIKLGRKIILDLIKILELFRMLDFSLLVLKCFLPNNLSFNLVLRVFL
jgi:hypothetical protein